MNLQIKPGAALDSVREIEIIIETLKSNFEKLSAAFDKTIPAGIETKWSAKLEENWLSYNAKDIPGALEGMKASARNLKTSVDDVLKYSEQ